MHFYYEINATRLTSYLSKLVGLGLLTRRLCSCLIGLQPSNITTIIFEQIVKRFLNATTFQDTFNAIPRCTGHLSCCKSRWSDLNTQPNVYKAFALPFELHRQIVTGLVGFEPTNAGVKILCLTAWRQPNNFFESGGNTIRITMSPPGKEVKNKKQH